MTEPCTQDGSLVVCNLTRNGHPAQFAWDSDGEKNISAKGFKKLNDLDGNATPISGQVKVGAKPVLLEAQ